jgi:hypothetical protein
MLFPFNESPLDTKYAYDQTDWTSGAEVSDTSGTERSRIFFITVRNVVVGQPLPFLRRLLRDVVFVASPGRPFCCISTLVFSCISLSSFMGANWAHHGVGRTSLFFGLFSFSFSTVNRLRCSMTDSTLVPAFVDGRFWSVYLQKLGFDLHLKRVFQLSSGPVDPDART